jgi:hypothetical protein
MLGYKIFIYFYDSETIKKTFDNEHKEVIEMSMCVKWKLLKIDWEYGIQLYYFEESLFGVLTPK